MTNTTIQDMLFPMQPMTSATAKAPVGKDDEFGAMLQKQTENTQNQSPVQGKQPAEKKDTSDVSLQDKSVKPKKEIPTKVEEPAKEVENLSEEELTTATDALEEGADKVMEVIASLFQISPEELTQVLTETDTQPVELLDTNTLNTILQDVTGVTDSMDLLMDENLYSNFKEAMSTATEIGAEIANAMQIEPEDVPKLVEKVASQNTEVLDAESVATAKAMPNEKIEAQQEEPTIVVENNAVTQKQNPTTGQEEQSGADLAKQSESKPETKTHAQRHSEPVVPNNPFAVNANGMNDTLTGIQEAAQTGSYTDISTEDIMRQIMDHMRISLKPEMETLEMQLHPASLGNVQVQIGNKAGAITATFVTQNETVRAAMETQMISLQERFEEQGIKVEAIEITVSTNAFAQSFEQGSDAGQTNDFKSGTKAKRVRLDVNMTEQEMESLSEEEKLTVSMMEANGNTVDYMA